MVNLFNIMHVLYWNQHGYTLSSNLSLLSGSHFDVNHIKSKARYVLCENGRTVLDSNVKASLGAAEYWHDAVCCLLSDVVRYCTGYEVAVAVANAGYAVVMYATTLYDYLLYV